MSRRLRQDGDNEEGADDEDFVDWIDHLHGFLHQINIINLCPPTSPISNSFFFILLATLVQEIDLSMEDSDSANMTSTSVNDYSLIPRSV
jgi:hypothetical protein